MNSKSLQLRQVKLYILDWMAVRQTENQLLVAGFHVVSIAKGNMFGRELFQLSIITL